jgi:hypothetical protein
MPTCGDFIPRGSALTNLLGREIRWPTPIWQLATRTDIQMLLKLLATLDKYVDDQKSLTLSRAGGPDIFASCQWLRQAANGVPRD